MQLYQRAWPKYPDDAKLTYHFQGRDFGLTDVGGAVIEKQLV